MILDVGAPNLRSGIRLVYGSAFSDVDVYQACIPKHHRVWERPPIYTRLDLVSGNNALPYTIVVGSSLPYNIVQTIVLRGAFPDTMGSANAFPCTEVYGSAASYIIANEKALSDTIVCGNAPSKRGIQGIINMSPHVDSQLWQFLLDSIFVLGDTRCFEFQWSFEIALNVQSNFSIFV